MSIDHGKVLALLKIAKCPNEGCIDGGYYDERGEPCQCQWCDERNRAIAQPAEAVEGPLPPEAVEVFPSALNGGTALPGDWAIPRAPGINRIVDARMAYGWNECRKEMRRRLTLAAGDDVTDAAQGAVADVALTARRLLADQIPHQITKELLVVDNLTAGVVDTRIALAAIETALRAHQQAAPAQGDGWRLCYSAVIHALAAIVNIRCPDKLFDLDAIPRGPVMDQVVLIRETMDRFGKELAAAPSQEPK